MSKTWGFFFGGLGHGPESSCQISAYYKFFPGLHVFCRISTGLLANPSDKLVSSYAQQPQRRETRPAVRNDEVTEASNDK